MSQVVVASEVLARKPKRRVEWVQKRLRDEMAAPGEYRDILYQVLTHKEGRAFTADLSPADATRAYAVVLQAIDTFTVKQQRQLQADNFILRQLHMKDQERSALEKDRHGKISGKRRAPEDAGIKLFRALPQMSAPVLKASRMSFPWSERGPRRQEAEASGPPPAPVRSPPRAMPEVWKDVSGSRQARSRSRNRSDSGAYTPNVSEASEEDEPMGNIALVSPPRGGSAPPSPPPADLIESREKAALDDGNTDIFSGGGMSPKKVKITSSELLRQELRVKPKAVVRSQVPVDKAAPKQLSPGATEIVVPASADKEPVDKGMQNPSASSSSSSPRRPRTTTNEATASSEPVPAPNPASVVSSPAAELPVTGASEPEAAAKPASTSTVAPAAAGTTTPQKHGEQQPGQGQSEQHQVTASASGEAAVGEASLQTATSPLPHVATSPLPAVTDLLAAAPAVSGSVQAAPAKLVAKGSVAAELSSTAPAAKPMASTPELTSASSAAAPRALVEGSVQASRAKVAPKGSVASELAPEALEAKPSAATASFDGAEGQSGLVSSDSSRSGRNAVGPVAAASASSKTTATLSTSAPAMKTLAPTAPPMVSPFDVGKARGADFPAPPAVAAIQRTAPLKMSPFEVVNSGNAYPQASCPLARPTELMQYHDQEALHQGHVQPKLALFSDPHPGPPVGEDADMAVVFIDDEEDEDAGQDSTSQVTPAEFDPYLEADLETASGHLKKECLRLKLEAKQRELQDLRGKLMLQKKAASTSSTSAAVPMVKTSVASTVIAAFNDAAKSATASRLTLSRPAEPRAATAMPAASKLGAAMPTSASAPKPEGARMPLPRSSLELAAKVHAERLDEKRRQLAELMERRRAILEKVPTSTASEGTKAASSSSTAAKEPRLNTQRCPAVRGGAGSKPAAARKSATADKSAAVSAVKAPRAAVQRERRTPPDAVGDVVLIDEAEPGYQQSEASRSAAASTEYVAEGARKHYASAGGADIILVGGLD